MSIRDKLTHVFSWRVMPAVGCEDNVVHDLHPTTTFGLPTGPSEPSASHVAPKTTLDGQNERQTSGLGKAQVTQCAWTVANFRPHHHCRRYNWISNSAVSTTTKWMCLLGLLPLIMRRGNRM